MQIIHAPIIIIHHLVSVSNNTRTVQHKVHHDTGAKCVVGTSSLCFACHTPHLSYRHRPCHTHWLHVAEDMMTDRSTARFLDHLYPLMSIYIANITRSWWQTGFGTFRTFWCQSPPTAIYQYYDGACKSNVHQLQCIKCCRTLTIWTARGL